MGNCRQRGAKRFVSGMMAGLMVLSACLGTGSTLLAEAKEPKDTPKTTAVDVSIDGVTKGGDVSIVFTGADFSWSHTYKVQDGKATLDGKTAKDAKVTIPREKDVDVLVVGDDHHQITAISVQTTNGVDFMVPNLAERARNCTFQLQSVPKELSISVEAAYSEEVVPMEDPERVATGSNALTEALAAQYAQNTQGIMTLADLDFTPTVGQQFTGRATIRFMGNNISEPGLFNGGFTSGELGNLSYSGFECKKHGAANPGVSSEPASCVGDYTATVNSVGNGEANVTVNIVPDSFSSNYQNIGGNMRVTAKPPTGTVILKKYSAKPEYTNGNSAYDLTGARYGIYSDRACTNLLDTLVVQNNSGITNESIELEEGTYYAKELVSPRGYQLNSRVKAFSVESGTYRKQIDLNGDMADPPLQDPTNILLQKAFPEWTEGGKLQGDITTLAGIKFRFDYYAGLYDTIAQAQASGAPRASAVFETRDVGGYGLLVFTTATPVNGTTWPYKTDTGMNTFPLGTVVITEIQALDGMVVSGVGCGVKISANADNTRPVLTPIENWSNQSTSGGALGSFENEIWKGSVKVYKADADGHVQRPQGDASLNAIQYEIYNKSRNSISYNGKEIPVNGRVCTIATIDNYAVCENLPYGTYQIVESKGNQGYNKASWEKTFSIRQNNQEVRFDATNTWNEDPVKRGGIDVVKGDADTGLSVPQGDAELQNTSYDLYNKSMERVYVNGSWFAPDAKIMTRQAEWDSGANAYVAKFRDLPYGTYVVKEAGAPIGYHKAEYTKQVHIRGEEVVRLYNAASGYNVDEVFRGGVSVTKADADSHTSKPQGDASLEGVEYQIINRSREAVFMRDSMEKIAPGAVAATIRTAWNEQAGAYVASTSNSYLPYGTYEIVETKVSPGYVNARWSQTFTIRQEGEMHYFDSANEGTTVNGYQFHHKWNENHVVRGGITVGKVDRETGQYLSLGEAHLDGATFEVINRSNKTVYVNGKAYKAGDCVMTIASRQQVKDGKTVYVATTGERALPYGTYEVKEIGSGTGYLFNKQSKDYTKTVQIRSDGQMTDLTSETNAVSNQVLREDWHFQKKAEDSMERMDKIAFLVESLTTGERHVLVTDENGTWGSSWIPHTQKTNENDPTSPITNGALGVKEDGTWYVKDSSKLNFDSGIWFTGRPESETTWASNGKSYILNGKTVAVNDKLRAFPYDTYRVQELRCDNNKGYKLVNFTVTLHRYTPDHDGPGLDIDYGTIDDKRIAIGTILSYGASDKVSPAGAEVTLRDTVTYDNLDVGKRYLMKGELHLVNEDGSDGGVLTRAEKEFNAGNGAGRMVMEFKVDTSKLGGKSLVAFEYLTEDGHVIAEHEDIADENQTVWIPEIKTTLTGDLGHVSNGNAGEITLRDKITYKNLEVGKEYTAHGTLMDKKTGETVTDADGNPITAERTFVPTSSDGSVTVVFTFSGVPMAGKEVVAFESVVKDDVEYAVHSDIEDANQTVGFPEVDTTAVNGKTRIKLLAEAKNQSILDTIHVTNLDKDYNYKLTGILRIRNADGSDGGAVLTKDDKPLTAETTWKGGKTDHTMTFTGIDASKLGGKDIVVYQTLYGKKDDGKWIVLGSHEDITDNDQSVSVPHIGTTMVTGQEIHESQVPADGMIELKDTVSYENLIPGQQYVVVGTLHVQDKDEDGKLVDGGAFQVNGKEVTKQVVFTPTEKNGAVDVVFKFNASGLEGKSVTAFETLYFVPTGEDGSSPDKDFELADHEDIKDEGQTVHFAKIKTTLTGTNGLHETQVPVEDAMVTLTDVVAYQNLIPGHTYTMTGTLHIQDVDENGRVVDGGTVKDAEGHDVTAVTVFTPIKPNGKVEVVFHFDAKGLNGQTVVAFESVSVGDKEFATHTDITDESQSVHFVDLHTTAVTENGLQEIQVPKAEDKTITITDTVTYKNVIPGTEYTMTGTLHLKSVDEDGNVVDGGALLDADGKEITSDTTFTAKEADGSVEMTFTLDASELNGKTLVVFETLTKEDVFVAEHADIDDEGQTIRLVDIGTTALAENELHETQVPNGEDKTVTIKDRVDYTNLIPGTEYTMSGTLHLQEIDEDGTITDGGALKDVTSSITFIPETPDGFVELPFTFDASELEGKTVVAFEELSKKDIIIAVHTEIEDEDQAVHFATLHTTALAENGLHETQVPVGADKTVVITDTVAYENLIPGKTYKVSGTLHIQDVDENGHIIDGGAIPSSALVEAPPEDSSEEEPPIEGEAEDKTDADGKDESSGDAEPPKEITGVISGSIDRKSKQAEPGDDNDAEVPGEDVKPEEDVDSEDTEVIESEDLVAETVFIPETPSGTVDVVFRFDASELAGKTVVAFETLFREDKVIGTHADIEDEAQSVNFVRIRTKALAENGEHEMELSDKNKTVKITDLVEYKNLIPGMEYTLTGEFHIKSTDKSGTVTDGGVLKDRNGKVITSSVTFTPEEPDGSVEVPFEIDAFLLADQTVVAFETLSYEDITVAVHTDIADEHQSVTFKSKTEIPVIPPDTPIEVVKTGQVPFYLIFIAFGVVLMAGGGYVYFRKKQGR